MAGAARDLGTLEEQDPRVIEETSKALWDYCAMDTLAMVRILERLEEI